MMDSLEMHLKTVKIEMMEREIADLKAIMSMYANPELWHNDFEIPYVSLAGEGFKNVWARQENGWELAQRILGDF